MSYSDTRAHAFLDGRLHVPKPHPNYFNFPTYSVTGFVARPGPIETLSRHLEGEEHRNSSSSIAIFVLQGMGGCGKSQLALEYCKQARLNAKHKTIVWIDATSSETTMLSFTKIAEAMLKPAFDASDMEGNFRYVQEELDKATQTWLVVFDNYDEPKLFHGKQLKEYFPTTGPGSILVTSRLEVVRSLGHHSLDVEQLLEAEALEILLRRTRRSRSEQDLTDATNIIKRLGYHALAIDQAGAYILKRQMDLSVYLSHYNQQREKVLNEAPEIWDYMKMSKDSAERGQICTVFATLELSLESISGKEQERKDKEHILTLTAFLDINRLTDTMFTPYGSVNEDWIALCQDADDWNECAFQDVLSELHNLSLLQSLNINSSAAFFTIHPLVQDWLKARIGKEQAKEYVVDSMLVLSKYLFKHGASDHFTNADFHTKQFMLAHVDATILAKQEFYDGWSFLQGSSLLNASMVYYIILGRQGRYHQAAEICWAVLAAWTNERGEEHPSTLATMHNLSSYLIRQGNCEEAEPLLRKCVAIEIKIHGKEAFETLQSLNALTDLLIMQKKYEEADSTSKEAMEVSVGLLGRDHESTVSIVRNRAGVLMYFGNHSEAARMNKENLETSKRVLGIQHPQTLTVMNNLAVCLEKMERFEEAETFFREALSLKEKTYGPNHPETTSVTCNLAVILYKQARLTEAEELFRRTYPVFESVHGWQHPTSIIFLGWMSSCLKDLGKYEEAERIQNLLPESERQMRRRWLDERKSQMAVRD